jgi:hypothetical protein
MDTLEKYRTIIEKIKTKLFSPSIPQKFDRIQNMRLTQVSASRQGGF